MVQVSLHLYSFGERLCCDVQVSLHLDVAFFLRMCDWMAACDEISIFGVRKSVFGAILEIAIIMVRGVAIG